MPDASKDIGPLEQASAVAHQTPRKHHLLLIAIDAYQHLSPLYNAVRDAEALMHLLWEKYQFEKAHTVCLFNQDATRSNIYKALDHLVDTITPQDNLLLFFSGHGEYRQNMEEGYWIPVDVRRDSFYDFLPNQQIQHYLKRIKSHHSFVVVDSCFSGTLFTARDIGPAARLDTIPSRWLLSAGRNELVSDGKAGDHSPFAKHLLHFLKHNQEAALPISRLIEHVVHATAANAKQTPRGEPIQDTGHMGGQFFFNLKMNEAADWTKAKAEGTIEGYTRFLTLYPTGRFCAEAKAALEKAKEGKAWAAALKANTIPAFVDFEAKFPNSPFAKEVDERVAELEEEQLWQEAQRSDTVSGYRKYLQRTPLKKYDAEAKGRIDKLMLPKDEGKNNTDVESAGGGNVNVYEDPAVGSFILVKGGTFDMGCTVEQKGCRGHERPVRTVTLSDYYIGETVVTQAQWRAVMGSDPPNLQFKGCDACPVEMVSWNDAQEFISRLNSMSGGMRYRLPTEAEWEYAARGGSMSRGFMYAGSNNLDEVAWYGKNSGGKSQPVRGKKPNELGLYDMSGNVWEWCSDWKGTYPSHAESNPSGPSSGSTRVIRGGSWDSDPVGCRVAFRYGFTPDRRIIYLGFRLARTP